MEGGFIRAKTSFILYNIVFMIRMIIFRDRTFLLWGCPGGAGIENFTMSEVLYVGRFAESLNYFLFYFFWGGRYIRKFFTSGNSRYRKVHTIRYSGKFVVWGDKLH